MERKFKKGMRVVLPMDGLICNTLIKAGTFGTVQDVAIGGDFAFVNFDGLGFFGGVCVDDIEPVGFDACDGSFGPSREEIIDGLKVGDDVLFELTNSNCRGRLAYIIPAGEKYCHTLGTIKRTASKLFLIRRDESPTLEVFHSDYFREKFNDGE